MLQLVRRTLRASLICAVSVAIIGPAAAGAATTVGSTFTPEECFPPGSGSVTYFQTLSPAANSYSAPSDGILTSWSYQATSQAPTVKLFVARPTGDPNQFLIVGTSVLKGTSGGLNTFTDISIPVQAGDFLGLRLSAGGFCGANNGASFISRYSPQDPQPGETLSILAPAAANLRLDVSATLEADDDGDGLGDETEDSDDDADGVADAVDDCALGSALGADTDGDGCKDTVEDSDNDNDQVTNNSDNCQLTPNGSQLNSDGDAEGDACDSDDDNDGTPDAGDSCPTTTGLSSNAGCPDTTAPQTRIIKKPAKVTRIRVAKFRFASNEAGSTFQCRVDKRAWRSCKARFQTRVKPGRHVIRVRAEDNAGNRDKTPAVYRWRVLRG